MEFLRFIFSSFWVWLGFVVLVAAAVVEEVHTITDIVCVHSVKNGTVTFLHELDNSGKLVHIAATPRPEQREAATQSGGVMLIAGDESGPLPPEFVDFIKRRFE